MKKNCSFILALSISLLPVLCLRLHGAELSAPLDSPSTAHSRAQLDSQNPAAQQSPSRGTARVQRPVSEKTAPSVVSRDPSLQLSPDSRAISNRAHHSKDETRGPDNPIDYLKDNEWQKYAELRDGHTYFLRRSTNTPPGKNDVVIVRWQTPNEFNRRAFLSSRGFSPAEQRLEAARLRMPDDF